MVASAQSTVPPTARQAAQSPAFNPKLHPPVGRHLQRTSRRRPKTPSPQDQILYDNGPINGSVDAWTINFGYSVTDSFTLGSASTITSFTFGVWAYSADTPLTVDYSISSSPFGGAPTTLALTSSFQYSNQYGYDIDSEAASGLNIPLGPGTYWLTLQNAVTTQGNPLYWDENGGPSQAEQSALGTIPSEAFTIIGSTGPPPPSCSTPKVISTVDNKWLQGVTMNKAGDLYGAAALWGSGPGMIYQLSPSGQGWLLTPLYDFSGGYDGDIPSPVVVGPEGGVYGASYDGGIQDCQDGCGLVYRLTPGPDACRTALCSWTEDVLHRFSLSDGTWTPTGNLVFDRAGNLYGTATNANDGDTVYELTPSLAGWTEKVLYSFPYQSSVTSLLVGTDGNLYGVAEFGGNPQCDNGCGTVFELLPSGSGWTKQDIFSFDGGNDGYHPQYLVQDASGNLYGTSETDSTWPCGYRYYFDIAYMLSRSAGGWTFNNLYTFLGQGDGAEYGEKATSVAIDAAGNLYVTTYHDDGNSCEAPGGSDYSYGAVYEASQTSFQSVFYGTFFETEGPLAVDGGGNLYGTGYCYGSSDGIVWTVPQPQRLAK